VTARRRDGEKASHGPGQRATVTRRRAARSPSRPLAESPRRRVALLGGTFDPPHLGHLVAAQEAAVLLELDQVLFLPAGRPPHKLGEPVSALDIRVRMVELAIAGNPRFGLSRADLDGPGPSYTADLLERLRADLSPGELYFLVGMDSLRDLTTWKDPARVLAQCILVVFSRPGHRPVDLKQLERSLPGAENRILVLHTPAVDVSSTDLRARVASGRPIRYLVPESVRMLIEAEGLYK
jgi:nicotinate-nucleotide adenylyltransferase